MIVHEFMYYDGTVCGITLQNNTHYFYDRVDDEGNYFLKPIKQMPPEKFQNIEAAHAWIEENVGMQFGMVTREYLGEYVDVSVQD